MLCYRYQYISVETQPSERSSQSHSIVPRKGSEHHTWKYLPPSRPSMQVSEQPGIPAHGTCWRFRTCTLTGCRCRTDHNRPRLGWGSWGVMIREGLNVASRIPTFRVSSRPTCIQVGALRRRGSLFPTTPHRQNGTNQVTRRSTTVMMMPEPGRSGCSVTLSLHSVSKTA